MNPQYFSLRTTFSIIGSAGLLGAFPRPASAFAQIADATAGATARIIADVPVSPGDSANQVEAIRWAGAPHREETL